MVILNLVFPFQKAFEILSKSLDKKTFKVIQNCVEETRLHMTEEEAIILWPKINRFVKETHAEPNISSFDPQERRMAENLLIKKSIMLQERQMEHIICAGEKAK